MLVTLKMMQKQGIFKLFPNDNLDRLISLAVNESDIASQYDSIKKYLKNLINHLSYEHNVVLSRTISDFEDKFSYEMFDMACTCTNFSNGIYQKETSYGNAGNCSIGVDMLNATFTLEERKLLKMINHYYISLMNKDGFDDDYFFIPMETLKLVFPKVNSTMMKKKIIDTCTRLNNKTIYWDLSKTRYNKKLLSKNLNVGNKEKLLDINILYFPTPNKNSADGVAIEIKGVICRINKFMRLRFELGQISNRLPIETMSCNYLTFIVAEKIDYRLHMLKIGPDNKKRNYNSDLRNLVEDIYVYCNHAQQRDTYLSRILNEPNSKDNILKLLEAIITALNNLSDAYIPFVPILKVKNQEIRLDRYLASFKSVTSRNELDELLSDIYNSIVQVAKITSKAAPLRYLIKTGNLSLIMRF